MRGLMQAVSAVAVLILLLAFMVVLMPKDQVLALAEREFARTTGRQISIGPSARVSIWPVLGVSAGPVRIANADWAQDPALLSADQIGIGLDMAALLSGQVRITEVVLEAPVLSLERDAQGRGNWALGQPAAAPATPAGSEGLAQGLPLESLQIRNGQLRLRPSPDAAVIELTEVDLQTAVPLFDGPVSVSAEALKNGQPITLEAEVASLAGFLGGKLGDLQLTATAGTNRLTFTGRATASPAMAEGRVEIDLPDRPALETMQGAPLPDLPQGYGAEQLAAKADLTLTRDGSLHLRGAEITTDGHLWSAEIDLQPGKTRPRLTGRLQTESLPLPMEDGSGDGAPADGWPTTPIDASALGQLDADLALSAQSVAVGGVTLGPTRARLQLDDARAVLVLSEVQAYGGEAKGQIVVNARKGLSTSAKLGVNGLDTQALLADLAGSDRLIGKADLQLDLLASGTTVAALMASLSGKASLSMGKGEVAGLDIAGMLRTMDPGYVGEGKRTVFDRLSVSTTLKDGVATSEDLALTSTLFTAGGTGSVDLGQRKISYRLLPQLAAKADGSAGLTVPVLISGPWAKPQVRLDLEWLASERAKAEQARAEALARQRIEELAQEKLGITPEAGESLEDAARRRAREAAEAETGRILDKLLQGN